MSGDVALRSPRVIAGASEIPLLWGSFDAPINLTRTKNASEEMLRAAGAFKEPGESWQIGRDKVVDLDVLEAHLPVLACKSVIPTVVDLIPESSWGASLANILTANSWAKIRMPCLVEAGACEECGSVERLECHEVWAYDECQAVQTLIGFRCVCFRCHEMYHLGLAQTRGRFGEAFRRLAVINRIRDNELRPYREAIVDKFRARSEIEWALDLSILKGMRLAVKARFERVTPNLLMGDGPAGEVEILVQGVSLGCDEASGRKVVLS